MLNQHRNHLSIGHLNTQSMLSSFDEFSVLLESHKFDVFALSETWLKDDSQRLKYVTIPGYQFTFKNREVKRGGGVGLYIKDELSFKERKDIDNLDVTIGHHWVELKGKNKNSNLLLGTMYQPSSCEVEKSQWLEKLDTLLSLIHTKWNGPIVITGDFNIDLSNPGPNSRNRFLNIITTYDLEQVITKPTRMGKTLIDHIITNIPKRVIHEDVIACGHISDHDAPYTIINVRKERYEPRYKMIRNEKNFDREKFINDSEKLPLNLVYSFDDIDDKLHVLNTLVLDCINQHAPLKRVKLTRPPAPWMKELDIVNLQREFEIDRTMAHQFNSPADWDVYRRTRNKLKRKIKETKRSFYKRALSSKRPKEVWQTIHRLLKPSNSRITVDPEDINTHFNETALRLTGRKGTEKEQLETTINDLPDQPNEFNMRNVTYDEVRKAINSLRSDCSTGFDNIPVKYVKMMAESLISPVTHLINECINKSIFPSAWKTARICPIPKVKGAKKTG